MTASRRFGHMVHVLSGYWAFVPRKAGWLVGAPALKRMLVQGLVLQKFKVTTVICLGLDTASICELSKSQTSGGLALLEGPWIVGTT